MKATPKGTVLSSSVKNVGSGIEVRAVEAEEVARFESLLCERHYLGEAKPVGDFLRQVALREGEWVGLLVWWGARVPTSSRTARAGLAGVCRSGSNGSSLWYRTAVFYF